MKSLLSMLTGWTFVLGLLAPVSPATAAPALQEGEYYLAHNLWYENPERMYSINYKKGTVLPAGSVVSKVEVHSGRSPTIRFHHHDTGINGTIQYTPKYHGSLSVQAFKDRMLTKTPLEERAQGMSEEEKDAIAAGQIQPGMSKEAVLISWGYPPEHRTPSLETSTWIFWTSRFANKTLVFDEAGKLAAAPAALPPPVREAKASTPLNPGEFYLVHNVWYESPSKLYSINYKKGTVLPAGSVVSNLRFKSGRTPRITFHHNDSRADFTIHFTSKYHGSLSAEAFKDRMLTTETLENRSQGMSELDKNAIAAGQITPGMSKEAVLISWGYPPEHKTPSLKTSNWIYWTSRFVNKTLVFDKDGKLQ